MVPAGARDERHFRPVAQHPSYMHQIPSLVNHEMMENPACDYYLLCHETAVFLPTSRVFAFYNCIVRGVASFIVQICTSMFMYVSTAFHVLIR
jgi:hypothetical protein